MHNISNIDEAFIIGRILLTIFYFTPIIKMNFYIVIIIIQPITCTGFIISAY